MIVGDSLDYSNNSTFSTLDQDNDEWSSNNCALFCRSAGWFKWCAYANLNGQYTDSEIINNPYNSIAWHSWKNMWISLKTIQMMIRPRV